MEGIAERWSRLVDEGPLVHNLTNYVVMNSTANALLAVGASPAMVHAADEVEDFAGLARALVVNVGTLSSTWVASMRLAVATAAERSIPWVLDPVGVGATRYRTAVSADLARRGPTVIRANASEVLALAGSTTKGPKGVDSTASSADASSAARALASELGTVVVASGAVDLITDGERVATLSDGHPMMSLVTGMGCTASALVAAFLAVEPDPFVAATSAMAVLGVVGARAAESAPGPGTLQLAILDGLYAARGEALEPRLELS
ncbi:MAG: hydroxyethylthiazole kinase [Sandaracinaceae bacterium]